MRPARPTSALFVVSLIALGLVVGRLTPPIIVRLGGSPPRLGWVAPLMLLAGALVVGTFAYNTWQTLHRQHQRMTADHGIKMLSLAKASAIVAAMVAGFYGGFALGFVDNLDTMLGKERFVRGLISSAMSLLLLVAALLLERACRLPEDDDDKKGGPGGGGGRAKRRPDPNPA